MEQHHILIVVTMLQRSNTTIYTNSEKRVLTNLSTIVNNVKGFYALLEKIQKSISPQIKIRAWLETTGCYSYNLLNFLLYNSISPMS